MKKVFFNLILILFLFEFIGFAQANDNDVESCAFFNALYEPAEGGKLDTFNYTISFRDIGVENQKGPNLPIFYFVIKAFDKETNSFLDQYEMPYICTAGSLPTCYVAVGKNQSTHFMKLNKDFSSPVTQGNASDFIILPDIYRQALLAARSEKNHFFSDIEGLEHGVYRDRLFSIGSVWKLTQCNN